MQKSFSLQLKNLFVYARIVKDVDTSLSGVKNVFKAIKNWKKSVVKKLRPKSALALFPKKRKAAIRKIESKYNRAKRKLDKIYQ